ncbi:MAG: NUDIX domain-containing protein [Bacteroidales bacterium]|nr:NUDIX domain-containing protein [Bacteroidales bacterium]
MSEHQFNIRVYGLLIEEGKILVTDEFRLNTLMTKFPGGAMEFGEGTIDCLKREFMEELNLKIEVAGHFYTTDYFQPTMLLPSAMQLISIYYLVKPAEPMRFPVAEMPFSFPQQVEGAQCFRWIPVSKLTEEDVTFPIDKHVVSLMLTST